MNNKMKVQFLIVTACICYHVSSFAQNTFPQSGNVGIGTTVPETKLHVFQSAKVGVNEGDYTSLSKFAASCGTSNALSNNMFLFRDSPGDDWWSIRLLDGIGIDVSFQTPALSKTWWMRDPYDDIQAWGTASSTYLSINRGNIGVGTIDTKGYKLAVAGNMIAESVKVKLKSNWPDYVFEPSHPMLSLGELNEFIKKNKHLPEIPSAKEIERNGIDLGETNAMLLKKIEELTLYLIQKDKELETAYGKIQDHEDRLNKMEMRLSETVK